MWASTYFVSGNFPQHRRQWEGEACQNAGTDQIVSSPPFGCCRGRWCWLAWSKSNVPNGRWNDRIMPVWNTSESSKTLSCLPWLCFLLSSCCAISSLISSSSLPNALWHLSSWTNRDGDGRRKGLQIVDKFFCLDNPLLYLCSSKAEQRTQPRGVDEELAEYFFPILLSLGLLPHAIFLNYWVESFPLPPIDLYHCTLLWGKPKQGKKRGSAGAAAARSKLLPINIV